jgi:hypothetical protein
MLIVPILYEWFIEIVDPDVGYAASIIAMSCASGNALVDAEPLDVNDHPSDQLPDVAFT